MMEYILIVEDDDEITKDMIYALTSRLQSKNLEFICKKNADKAINSLNKRNYSLVITDLKMPPSYTKDEGKKLVDHLKLYPELKVIVMTAYGEIEDAVECLKMGAFDFIEKPIDYNKLADQIKKALEERKKESVSSYSIDDIIGSSNEMQKIFSLMKTIIDKDVRVLIEGETGTGKELVARALHYDGPRRGKPFIIVNCPSIQDQLFESELFGHKKGAFTGAIDNRVGRFKLADGGTIFLDEIGDFGIEVQAKIFRVLEDGVFERLGDSDPIEVDVRVIAATNLDLKKLIQQGKFREELFFRLNLVKITLPPLRNRVGDVAVLANYFLNQINAKWNKGIKGFEQGAIRFLETYAWPGNVRELKFAVERAVLYNESNQLTENDFTFLIEDKFQEYHADDDSFRKQFRVRNNGASANNSIGNFFSDPIQWISNAAETTYRDVKNGKALELLNNNKYYDLMSKNKDRLILRGVGAYFLHVFSPNMMISATEQIAFIEELVILKFWQIATPGKTTLKTAVKELNKFISNDHGKELKDNTVTVRLRGCRRKVKLYYELLEKSLMLQNKDHQQVLTILQEVKNLVEK